MAEGYIYILFNRAFQNDQYKIGMTTKTGEERARELSAATGIPRDFEVLYELLVIDCKRAEQLLHDKLRRYRSAGNREFFQIPLKEAIKALEGVADEIGRVEHTTDGNSSAEGPTDGDNDFFAAQSGEITVTNAHKQRRPSIKKSATATVTFDDHASYIDAVRRPILIDLRNRILQLDHRLPETERCTPGQRIAYKIPGGRVFLEVKVQRGAIVLHLADGGHPDPSGIADDIPESHGWRQLKKRITILGAADLNAVMPFVEAAYRARP
ncbi:GIY-YIG nuclease family protein [Rhizobium ruizarguesonis]|uniref:GIY-YIG nuclease family protein n=1 Tax=Rhizobium ruizarguesonis TaxID=2081791 RepID=UPI0013EEA0B1|nr:GIY-YIG nuclease family protein [Rhizobium ruizarguesonis]